MSGASFLDRPALRQLLRFGVVGVANTLVCLAIVWTLHDGYGVAPWLASAAGYAVALIQSFLLNRSWTFANTNNTGPVGRQFPMFIALNITTGVLFSTLTSVLTPMLGIRPASVLALVPTTLISFLAMRFVVFGGRRRE